MPFLDKLIGGIVKLVYLDKLDKNRGKIGENIFLIDSSEKNVDKIEVDTILLRISEINIEKFVPDILYFGNIYIPYNKKYDGDKYKDKSILFQVIYPRIIIKNREFLIQLL